ncbi:MAG: pseudouridine synthase [Planctomycetota bacterium]|nr:pseudouridine synthase [Planctomycetota bacterium]
MTAERLQKLLARAGFGSRRACEDLITAGRVSVDGRIVIELGAKADLDVQDVRLDGSRLKPERPEYWILNKPKDVVCTNFDPAGRRRPIDIMQRYTKARLFAVGRLDVDSKGLLLMTNDGPLVNSLTHPRYEVPKTYVATVVGDLTPDSMRRIRRGVWLAEGRTRPAQVRVISHGRSKSIVEITIREGRNRQVRRMLAHQEHNVRELVRTRIGHITLRGLKVGEARRLEPDEVEYLKKLPETPPEAPAAFDRGRAGAPRGPGRFQDRGPRRFQERPARFQKRPPAAERNQPAEGPPIETEHPFAGRPDRGPGRFEKRGPGAERGRDRGPGRFEKRGPGAERGRDRGPGRFEKRGPKPFDNRGPRKEQGGRPEGPSVDVPHPFAGRPDRGPPRGPPGRDRGPKRRNDFGKFKGESKGERPQAPRESYGEKRSRRPHDTDGTRKEGEGFRGREGRGGSRGRGRPDRPPFGGRRPDRRSPK